MIEIILGLLLLAAGAGLSLGILGGVLSLGGLEFVAGVVVAALGAVLLVHGLYRRVRDGRDGDSHGLRSGALMMTTLLGAAIVVVFGVAIFGQVTWSGFPFGYHAVAEGIPLALLILFLVFKNRQLAIDLDGLDELALDEERRHGV
jgi:putative solute:sodium symporter small subunit